MAVITPPIKRPTGPETPNRPEIMAIPRLLPMPPLTEPTARATVVTIVPPIVSPMSSAILLGKRWSISFD